MTELKRILSQDDTLLFIGSGISMWSGLPSWKGLLLNLADFMEQKGIDFRLVRREIENGDLLQAASYGFDRLTTQQRIQFLRENCSAAGKSIHEIHRLIVGLGPTSYVTTNFDPLLERALTSTEVGRSCRVVLNENLADLPEITSSRASNFIFKSHGDVETPKSVILTREHYRRLLPGGNLHGVSEALRMILLGRPVVYLGFGLRDPDFLYARDLLANTFEGSCRDHYAIVPDATSDEVEFWRRHYSIHLISYETTQLVSGTKDHSALLELMRGLAAAKQPAVPVTAPDRNALLLAVLRHVARLGELRPIEERLPLQVSLEKAPATAGWHPSYWHDRFDGRPAQELLTLTKEHSILSGAPGTGKSFAMKSGASDLAAAVNRAFVSSAPDHLSGMFVPIFIELRAYGGSLEDLVDTVLPLAVSLGDLEKFHAVKLFLDAVDEIPRQWLELGHWKDDLTSFIHKHQNLIIVASSRRTEDLSGLGFMQYSLDNLDEEFTRSALSKSGYIVDQSFSTEAYSVLRRPFYFNLIRKNKVQLNFVSGPRDLCSSLINYIASEISPGIISSDAAVEILSKVAFCVIESGSDIFTSSLFYEMSLISGGLHKRQANTLLLHLIEKQFVIPYPAQSIAFFHKEVTEYLAASELAKQIASGVVAISDLITWRKWDHTLHITLSLLDDADAGRLFETLIATDLDLALAAPLYAVGLKDALITRILAALQVDQNRAWKDIFQIQRAIESYKYSTSHRSALLALAANGNMLGGSAAVQASRLSESDALPLLFTLLVDYRNDFNFCQEIVVELSTMPIASLLDPIEALVRACDELIAKDPSEEDRSEGLIQALTHLFESVAIAEVLWLEQDINRFDELNEFRKKLVVSILEFSHDQNRKLEVAADVLEKRNIAGAEILGLFHLTAEEKDPAAWYRFGPIHIDACIDMLFDHDHGRWAESTLINLCIARPDLVDHVERLAARVSPGVKVCLLYAAHPKSRDRILQGFGELGTLDEASLEAEPLEAFTAIRFEWLGSEDLLRSLLRRKSRRLALGLLEHLDLDVTQSLSLWTVDDVKWFVEWMAEPAEPNSSWMLRETLHRFCVHSLID